MNKAENLPTQSDRVETQNSTEVADELEGLISPAPLSADDSLSESGGVLHLQRTLGNAYVQRRIQQQAVPQSTDSPNIIRRTPLSDRLRFQSRLESGAATTLINNAHPMIANFLGLWRETLLAFYVERDEGRAISTYGGCSRIASQLRQLLRDLGMHAPMAFTWETESWVLSALLDDALSGPRMARQGAYSEGREEYALRALIAVNRRIVQLISSRDQVGSSARRLPGGSIARKIYLGSVVIPTAIVNFYLNLTITGQGAAAPSGPGTVSTSAGTSTDQSGSTTGSAGVTAHGSGGSQLDAGAEVGSGGITPTVGVTGQGPAGTSVQAQASASGPSSTVTVPGSSNWSTQINITPSAITYSCQHSSQAGLSLRGGLDGINLTAMAPELKMGQSSVRASLETEVLPQAIVWERSGTQTRDMVRFTQQYLAVLAVLAAAPIVVAGAVEIGTAAGAAAVTEAGAAALPRVILTLGQAAQGTMMMAQGR